MNGLKLCCVPWEHSPFESFNFKMAMLLYESLLHPKLVGRYFDQANTHATAISSTEETIPRLHIDVQAW